MPVCYICVLLTRSMSYGMMWGARWGGHLGDCLGWKYMSTCGSTLGCGTWSASVVASVVYTPRSAAGAFSCCGISFVGGSTCEGAAMFKISVGFFRVAVCLFPSVVSWLAGSVLIRVWVMSAAE